MRKIRLLCIETKQEFDSSADAAEWLIDLPRCKSKNVKNIQAVLLKHVNGTVQPAFFNGKRYAKTQIKSIYGYTFKKLV